MAYDPIYAHEYYLKHRKKKKGATTLKSSTKKTKARELSPLQTLSPSGKKKKRSKPRVERDDWRNFIFR